MDRENLIISQQLNNLKAPSQNDGFLQKGRRRSKKDKVNRDYICGCGKTYLSYPALYTHIKNKHNQMAPKGTIVPSVNKSKNQQTEQASSVSKSNINKSAMGGQKPENASHICDEDDFMKDRLKDGHVVDKDFTKEQPFQFDFNLEDFELVNFLGFQGTCDPEYSFKENRNATESKVNSMRHLKVISHYLKLKADQLRKSIDGMSSMEMAFSVKSEEKSMWSEEENQGLTLQTRKRPFEVFQGAKRRETGKRSSNSEKLAQMRVLLEKLTNQKEKVDDDILALEAEKNSDFFENSNNEEFLKKQSLSKKHSLFYVIKQRKKN